MFSDSVVSVNFLIPVCSQFCPSLHLFIVITSLTLVMLVNGSPVCPPPSSPSLPPLKSPVGYYRDMFINAVCDSLLPALLLPLPPHFPHLSFLLLQNEICLLFFLSFVCLTALSFICPLHAVLLPFLFVLFVEISLFC